MIILVTAIGTACQKQVTQAEDWTQEPVQNEYTPANAAIGQEQTVPQNESKKAADPQNKATIKLVGFEVEQIFFIK